MGQMGPAIEVERREGRVGEKPAAHDVVDAAAAKEQAVGGLVAQNIEQGEAPADQEEGHRVGPPPVDGSGRRHHAERLDPGANHGERIATTRDAPKLVAPDGSGPAGPGQPHGRQDGGETLPPRDHGGGHRAICYMIEGDQARRVI